MERHGGNIYDKEVVLDYSVNINPFGMPSKVLAAASQGIRLSAQYPDISQTVLLDGLSSHHGIAKEQIVAGNGAAELIYGIVAALRPRKAWIAGPAFGEYEQALVAHECKAEYYLAPETEEYAVAKAALQSLQESDCELAFLCNPNNPTSRLTDPAILQELLSICREKGIYLVVDECFMDFVKSPKLYTCIPQLAECPFLIVLKAFTKLYAMPGLRLGYLLAGSLETAGRIRRVLPPWNVSLPAQLAGVAALAETQYVQESRGYLLLEREWIERTLREAGYKVYPGAANFLLFFGPEGLQETCLQSGILIRDGASFRGIPKGTYRIGVKMHEENEILMKLLQKAAGEKLWQK